MGIKNIILQKAQLMEKWGLVDYPPFCGVPSGVKELMQVFVNRETEMERALLTLDEGENILIRGMTGIGKTAFIMAVLYELERQHSEMKQSILTIHIRQFAGGTREEFYKVILYSLAKKMGPLNKRAREIVYALTGEEITKSRSKKVTGGIEVQVPALFTAKTEGELGGESSRVLNIIYPEHFVEELLDIAVQKYKKIVFAVDDLERVSNQGNIKKMLETSLDLIRDRRCSFIFTGRTLTILEDIYASGLNIFNDTIPLKPLSHEELHLIANRTLNLARYFPQENEALPFTKEAIDAIASKSFGIPRQFVILCARSLKLAVANNDEEINIDVFQRLFEQLQDEMAETDLPPDIRRILYLGLQQGGFPISKDAELDQVFEVLGVTTLKQFVDFADNLVQQDLLQRFSDHRGEILYRLAPGIEKLALTGADLKQAS